MLGRAARSAEARNLPTLITASPSRNRGNGEFRVHPYGFGVVIRRSRDAALIAARSPTTASAAGLRLRASTAAAMVPLRSFGLKTPSSLPLVFESSSEYCRERSPKSSPLRARLYASSAFCLAPEI